MEKTDPAFIRFRLDLAYDGRPFAGWQSQAGGNTVQDILLGELRRICPLISTVQGSGRTDAGVSATGQVAHFDAPAGWSMSGKDWLRALNSRLPPTIRVFRCTRAAPDFHARYSAQGKTYRYRISTGEVLSPLDAGLSWHRRGLEHEGLEAVLKLYEGTHDFRAFSARRKDGLDEERNTVRRIASATVVSTHPETLDLRFQGSGFLYKMVRFLVGAAAYCQEGRLSPGELVTLLGGGAERKSPYCAPPDGLLLEAVAYPPEMESECGPD